LQHSSAANALARQDPSVCIFADHVRFALSPSSTRRLMGHSIDKPKYGDGYGLKMKLKYLQTIAFTSPESIRAAA
jgi:hypothetical protein